MQNEDGYKEERNNGPHEEGISAKVDELMSGMEGGGHLRGKGKVA